MKKILFVCLGNICRSPLADGIAQNLIKKNSLNMEVDSAGTGDWHIGDAPCPNSIKVAKNNSIDISNLKSRQVKKEDFKKFDYIVAMDSKNVTDLKNLGAENILKIGDFGRNGECVPDPYFFDGFDGFDFVFDMIFECTENLLKEIDNGKL